MPQTSNAVAMSCGKIEISIIAGCGTWHDISGEAQTVTIAAQTKFVGDAYTFDGAMAIQKQGKRQPFDLTVDIVYTESATEAFERVRERFETDDCEANVCLRWSPGGGNAGDAQYTTPESLLTSLTFPPGDASTAGPVMAQFVVRAIRMDRTVIAT